MPTTPSPTLLLAHADRDSRRALSAQLDLDGYIVQEAPTTTAVIETLQRTAPAAIVLATLEQPASALRFLRDLRAGRIDHADAHVAVLTFAANDATSQLRAYDNGSDHHLPGDVAYVTLRAILAAVVRRAAGPQAAPRTLKLGSLTIDIAAHEVRVAGQPMPLPAKEFELLRTLTGRSPSKSCSRASGATAIRAPPGPWTPTPAACAAASPSTATPASCTTSGASATGSRPERRAQSQQLRDATSTTLRSRTRGSLSFGAAARRFG